MRKLLLLLVMIPAGLNAQEFTLADTLRGTLSSIRSCFDVTYYDLHLTVDIENRHLSGVNHIHFKTVSAFDSIQLDLFANMRIDSVLYGGQRLNYSRLHDAFFVSFPRQVKASENGIVSVYYNGNPTTAKNAPWDGGFVWKEDANGKPWVGVACEGTGASLWWPNKDHLSDEPDSMRVSCTVPAGLMCVANGDLIGQNPSQNSVEWVWEISYPINNYNVTLNIADYAHFNNVYVNPSGDSLHCDYYVLKENLDKAKEQFKQVPEMLDCFEVAFGPYPFYEDGYALVETPYAGMEHQSAIAYGNRYTKGYWGRYPGEMDFDYIIIHETGHEWWGNSVSMNDVADMWIHESFCTYSEAVYVECKYGYEKMLEYLVYQRNFINNRSPIYGVYGMNHEGNGGDMYYKGAWMIHTLRNVMNNDSLFKSILKGIAQEFAYETIDGEEIIEYVNQRSKYNYSPFFEQYLKYADVPVLEFKWEKKQLSLKWRAEAKGFRMPVIYTAGDAEKRVLVSNIEWVEIPLSKKEFKQLSFRNDLMLFLTKKIN
ncbi:MAG: M1 family metallopeptidase [Flavobacteriales bacterium]|nr:M1 family metallopeptidase [Flavobacteriales bacterium]